MKWSGLDSTRPDHELNQLQCSAEFSSAQRMSQVNFYSLTRYHVVIEIEVLGIETH